MAPRDQFSEKVNWAAWTAAHPATKPLYPEAGKFSGISRHKGGSSMKRAWGWDSNRLGSNPNSTASWLTTLCRTCLPSTSYRCDWCRRARVKGERWSLNAVSVKHQRRSVRRYCDLGFYNLQCAHRALLHMESISATSREKDLSLIRPVKGQNWFHLQVSSYLNGIHNIREYIFSLPLLWMKR